MVDTITAASGTAAGSAVHGPQPVAAQPVPARPVLAEGVRLLGTVQGTGFADSMWLVERHGRFVQLSELLYQVAEECDGSRSVEEITSAVSAQSKWTITPQQVEFLVSTKLLPLGILQAAPGEPSNDGEDTAQDDVRPGSRVSAGGGTTSAGGLLDGVQSPLRLTARRRLLGPGPIEAVSSALRVLFTPPLVSLLLAGVVVSRVWLYGLHGLARGITQFFARPALFIVLVLILFLASIFHEFGHASGLRYGGGRARGMGIGFYMIFPSLYTDVTDGYRLSRGQRIRTDVGGPYFDLIFSLGILAGYVTTRQEFLLFAVLLVDAEAVRQLLPFKRMDGYWLLADVVGLPDLTSLIRPLLGSLPGVGGRIRGERLPTLRRPVRIVLIGYLLFITVALPAVLAALIYFIPSSTARAYTSLISQLHQLPAAIGGHGTAGNRAVDVSVVVLSVLILLVQMLGMWAFIGLVVVRPAVRIVRQSRDHPAPVHRLVPAGLAGLFGGAALVFGALWPWASASGSSRQLAGVAFPAGRLALACGLAMVVVTPVMLVAHSRPVKYVASVVGVLLGLIGVALSVHLLIHPIPLFDQLGMTRGSALRAPAAGSGDEAAPAYGAGVTMAGGVLAALGAAAAVTALPHGSSARGGPPQVVGLLHRLSSAAGKMLIPASSRRGKQRRSGRRTLLVTATVTVSVVMVVAALFGLTGQAGAPGQSPPDANPGSGAAVAKPVTLRVAPPPWSLPSDALPYIRAAGLVASSGENLKVHYHAHLDIIDGGTAIPVPAGIGFVLRAGHVTALTALHTHRPDGVLHVESARDIPYTLGQVFTEWGVQLTQNCIGDRCTGQGEKLQIFVDGTPYSGDPAALVLRPHQEIALIHRPTKDTTLVPSRYDFPPGE